MNYYSTNNTALRVSLQQAVVEGLAPDNGLFMPERLPFLPTHFFESIEEKSFQEISYQVALAMLGDDVPSDELQKIIVNTISFDAPLVKVDGNIYSLELFHGPTLAFKDFGAKFLAGLLGYFARRQAQEMTVLVATSGDTGSAVANGFYNVQGTNVIVLYPSGKVSMLQEKQFTTLGSNIIAIEVEGTFDDCQRLVKQAFLDADLKKSKMLTSANSINIARLIPQMFYYFWAFAQLNDKSKEVVVSVPSGNFGNLTAGLMAKRMGLPIAHFIATSNSNDVVPAYLKTGVFSSRSSITTISNAMDVGNPSNFARMMDLYSNDLSSILNDVSGASISDEETRSALKESYSRFNYLMDPHGAVGYRGLKTFLSPDQTGIFLETAHPGKFREVVADITGKPVVLPPRLEAFLMKEKKSVKLDNSFQALKKFILAR